MILITVITKCLLFSIIINLVCADIFHEEFEIRHRRSRLIRKRRNQRLKENVFLTANKNFGDTKPFITEKTLAINENITTITTMDEDFIVKLHDEGLDKNIGITMRANFYSDSKYDSTFLYFKDNIFTTIQPSHGNDSDIIREDINVTAEIKLTAKKETIRNNSRHFDIVTHFLRIVESQHLLGDNCTAGTDLSLGEGVVDRYAQERFRVEADVAVNRANMLTRLWKYANPAVVSSEYFLYASVFSMVEFDEVIFAAGNCYDKHQYKDYGLFCPYAYRLPEGPILVKDLAVEYKYLSNTSEWFYIARKNAENVIRNNIQISREELKKYITTQPDVLVKSVLDTSNKEIAIKLNDYRYIYSAHYQTLCWFFEKKEVGLTREEDVYCESKVMDGVSRLLVEENKRDTGFSRLSIRAELTESLNTDSTLLAIRILSSEKKQEQIFIRPTIYYREHSRPFFVLFGILVLCPDIDK